MASRDFLSKKPPDISVGSKAEVSPPQQSRGRSRECDGTIRIGSWSRNRVTNGSD